MTKRSRILVVEDFPDVRQTLVSLLVSDGYDVIPAASLEEANSILSSESFQVAVLDVRLDDTDEDNRDGIHLMHHIHEKYPATAVIILTGYADVEMVRGALEPDKKGNSPAFGFLQKNEINLLLEYVSRAVLFQQLSAFWYERDDCELCVSLEPGHRIHLQVSGKIRFKTNSPNLLNLDSTLFKAWGNEHILDMLKGRFILKTVGRDLYRLLFEQHPPVLSSYQRALGSVSQNQKLQLAFETSRDLVGLPLEFLFSDDASDYLALLHPMTRQVRGVMTNHVPISADLIRQLVRTGNKLRVLLLVSNTEPRLDEIDQMGAALAKLLSPLKWLDLKYLPTDDASCDEVQELLNANKFHIVHYIGHGIYRESSSETSSLFFWEHKKRSGNVMPLTGNDLRFLLENSDTRLVHLTCCDGVSTGDSKDLLYNDYLGIADSIIQSGVPSVLGYRWSVDVDNAQVMTLAFYRSLPNHGSPELALLEAGIGPPQQRRPHLGLAGADRAKLNRTLTPMLRGDDSPCLKCARRKRWTVVHRQHHQAITKPRIGESDTASPILG